MSSLSPSRSNPRVPCNSGVLPHIDFSKWADPHHGGGGGGGHVGGPFHF